ncbi:MAG: dockerin type I domain-containing protein, partial [Chloroflexia bacterium]
VASTTPVDAWAVGWYSAGPDHTLVERYNDPCVTPTDTPTGSPSVVLTPSLTRTYTPTPSITPTVTATATNCIENPPCPTNTATVTATSTPTGTPTDTPTDTPTGTITPTGTYTYTPTDTAVPTLTPTPTGGCPLGIPCPTLLRGHVTWQGRPTSPSPRNSIPVTLTLRLGGDPAFEYSGYATDNNGYFSVDVRSLSPGTYAWRAKDPKYLATGGFVTLVGAQVTDVEMGLQRAGDAVSTGPTNFNVVNATDFTTLKNTFGKSLGQPGYDDRADFNGDEAVNATDFSLLRSNFGTSGAPPIGPDGGTDVGKDD